MKELNLFETSNKDEEFLGYKIEPTLNRDEFYNLICNEYRDEFFPDNSRIDITEFKNVYSLNLVFAPNSHTGIKYTKVCTGYVVISDFFGFNTEAALDFCLKPEYKNKNLFKNYLPYLKLLIKGLGYEECYSVTSSSLEDHFKSLGFIISSHITGLGCKDRVKMKLLLE